MLGEESPAEQSAFCGDQSESYNAITWRFSAAQSQLRTSDQPTLHSSTRCGDRNAPAPEPITKTKHQERGRQTKISRNTHTLNKYSLLSKMTIILTYSRSPNFKNSIFVKWSICKNYFIIMTLISYQGLNIMCDDLSIKWPPNHSNRNVSKTQREIGRFLLIRQ